MLRIILILTQKLFFSIIKFVFSVGDKILHLIQSLYSLIIKPSTTELIRERKNPRKHSKKYRTRPEELKNFARLENYMNYTFYQLYTNFDEFGQSNFKFKKSRIFINLIYKLSMVIFELNFGLNTIWPTTYIRQSTGNILHYLGKSRLLNFAAFSFFLFFNLIGSTIFEYFQLIGESYHIGHLSKVKNHNMGVMLSQDLNEKFQLNLEMITKSMPWAHVIFWFCLNSVLFVPQVIGYFDPTLNFTGLGKY